MPYVLDDILHPFFIADFYDLYLSSADSTEIPRQTTDAVSHDTKAETHNQAAVKEQRMRPDIDSQAVPTKTQIEEWSKIAEEKYQQIATKQKTTHSFAELASKVGEWEERIDGKKE